MTTAGDTKLQARRSAYSGLSTHFALLDDRQFRSALSAPGPQQSPWGHSYEATVGDSKVFVKRIPLTEREAARPWSTRNHFGLPTYYSYGVGSAGFGAWRELAGHIKTTNLVIEGVTPHFPMLLHHRVLPRTTKRPASPTVSVEYLERWNNSRAIGEYMKARAEAPYDLWLVLEHIPHRLSRWMMTHQARVDDIVDQVCTAVSLMRRNGIVHFDLHLANAVTDGQTVYVVDFGLVNDTSFHLTNTERAFMARHSHYDYGESISCLGFVFLWAFEGLDEPARERILRKHDWLRAASSEQEFLSALIDHADSITSGPLKIEPAYADALRRYREVILYMTGFLSELSSNPRKNTRYDDDHLRRLLEGAEAPID